MRRVWEQEWDSAFTTFIIKHATTKSAERSEEEACVYGVTVVCCHKICPIMSQNLSGMACSSGSLKFWRLCYIPTKVLPGKQETQNGQKVSQIFPGLGFLGRLGNFEEIVEKESRN